MVNDVTDPPLPSQSELPEEQPPARKKTPARKKALVIHHEAGEENPTCIKCGLWKNCKMPFFQSIHRSENEWVMGPPPNPADYTLVVGDVVGPETDEIGDLSMSEDVTSLERLGRKLGVLDQIWYTPPVRCRPAKTGSMEEGRLTKTSISRCWTKHVYPMVEKNKPRAIIAMGAVGAFAVMNRLDGKGLEKQWNHHADLGLLTYATRSFNEFFLNPDKRNAEELMEAFNYGFTHRIEDIKSDIEFVLAKDVETVMDWFEPVLEYFSGFEPGEKPLEVIPLSWDTETSSVTELWTDSGKFHVGLWSFHHPANDIPLLIPTPHYQADPISEDDHKEILGFLKKVMESERIRKVGQNLQYDENAVWKAYGFNVKGFLADTMILDFLMDPDSMGHGLDLLCRRYLPDVPRYWEALDEWLEAQPGGKNAEINANGYNRVPTQILYPYAAWDTLVVSMIFKILKDGLIQKHEDGEGGWFVMATEPPDVDTMSQPRYAFEARSIHHRLCTHMERVGTHIDTELVHLIRKHYTQIRDEYAAKLKDDPDIQRFQNTVLPDTISKSAAAYKQWKKFGTPLEINWKSTDQVKTFFIDFLGMKADKKTKSGGVSLDASVIHEFALYQGCTSADLLSKWRKADKFVDSFLKRLDSGTEGVVSVLHPDGKIHPQYKSAATATGRLACGGGYNMQAMPRDGAIKKIFCSRYQDGWVVTRDYSGIEVRILAIASKDPTLCQAFRDGKDPHFVTQQFFFKEKADAKNKSQRSICKRALFGRLYGQGDKGLYELLTSEGVISMDTGKPVSLDECKNFNQLIDQLYPGIADWVYLAHCQALEKFWCSSIFGFVRQLPGGRLYEQQLKREKGLTSQQRFELRDKDKSYSRINMMVAEAKRHSQNSPIQSSASDLTVFAAWECQKRLEKVDPRAMVIDVVHDDIWVDCPSSDLVPEVVSIMADVMNKPAIWLPEIFPGYKCDWIDIPIIGDCDVGLNPKDAFGCFTEPSRGHPLRPSGTMEGSLQLVTDASFVDIYGFKDAVPHPKDPEKKSVIPWAGNAAAVREALTYRKMNLD